MPYLPTNFGLLEPQDSDYRTSRVAVLPVPFERTTSYGKGTAQGPAAILRASQSMELWDEELQSEPYRLGIATLPPYLPEAYDMEGAMAELADECRRHIDTGKFLVTLGGEHSLSIAPIRAVPAGASTLDVCSVLTTVPGTPPGAPDLVLHDRSARNASVVVELLRPNGYRQSAPL